jgi:hypothetical protein
VWAQPEPAVQTVPAWVEQPPEAQLWQPAAQAWLIPAEAVAPEAAGLSAQVVQAARQPPARAASGAELEPEDAAGEQPTAARVVQAQPASAVPGAVLPGGLPR